MSGRAPRSAAPSVSIPAVGKPVPIKVPSVAERTLSNGLRVVAARRPGIPRLEVQLRVPTVRGSGLGPQAQTRNAVMAETLLSGTPAHTSVAIAEALQGLGAGLSASGDTEWVTVAGSGLATHAKQLLALLGDVVIEASFPSEEVALEKDRIIQGVQLARSQPDVIARDALVRRLYGDHPYGVGTPLPEDVASVTAKSLVKAHGKRMVAGGSVLVLVGDLTPSRALDLAEAAMARWPAGRPASTLRAPKAHEVGPTRIVARPGSVQTNIRIAGPALNRAHPDYPALVLANLVFGGYFTSRLVDNIRERRGYTYSPHSGIRHHQSASELVVSADVGTEVTAAALLEIRYELGRMAVSAVEQPELDAARRYLQGTLAMSVQTQAGLSSYLAMLCTNGLDVSYLREFPAALENVSTEDVLAAAVHLSPRRLSTVLVGDAEAIRGPVESFDDVVIEPSGG